MNVLIINDEKWTADMIREDVSWEKCGIHKVFTAYDAASAREQIKQGIFRFCFVTLKCLEKTEFSLCIGYESMNMKLNVFPYLSC